MSSKKIITPKSNGHTMYALKKFFLLFYEYFAEDFFFSLPIIYP